MPVFLAVIVQGLCRQVAAHIARDRAAGPWIVLVWSRISRIGQRFSRIHALYLAGTLPKPRRSYRLTKPRAPAKRPKLVLPAHGPWLLQKIPETALYGGELRQMLDDPQMPALLAAAPQLHRILRPLCLMMGVEPPPRPERTPPPAEPTATTDPATPSLPPKRPRRAPARKWGWPASWPPPHLRSG